MARFVPVPFKHMDGTVSSDNSQLFINVDDIWLIQPGWMGANLVLKGGDDWDVPMSPEDAAQYFSDPIVRTI